MTKTWIRATLLAAGAAAALTTGAGLASASHGGATISNSPSPFVLDVGVRDAPAPPSGGGHLPQGGLGLPQGWNIGR